MRKDAGGYEIRHRRTIGMYTAERSRGRGGVVVVVTVCEACVVRVCAKVVWCG